MLACRRACRCLVLGTLLASAVPAMAADAASPALPSVRTFFRNADVGSMQLSPSGKWLAMTAGGSATRVALAIVDVEGKSAPTVAAIFSDADVRSFRWVSDDLLIFNVIDQQSGGSEQRFGPGMFSVHRDGGELRQLIKPQRDFVRVLSPSRREALDWNHDLLAVPRDGSGEVIVGAYVYTNRGELDSVNALRLDVATGRTRSLSLARPPHVGHWLFDAKGEPRVTVAQFQGVTTVYWRGPGQQEWTEITSGPSLELKFLPRFVDDKGRLYVTTSDGRDGIATLRLFDFKTGSPEPRALVTTPGFDFSGYLVSDAAGIDVFGVRVLTDAESTVWFDPGMKEIQKKVDDRLPGHINSLSCSRCKDAQAVLVHSWSDQDPGSFWLYHPATNAWTSLDAVRADVVPARMATLDFFRAKARDGLDLPLWVTTPKKDAPGLRDGKRAAVVLVHGGPWVRGGSWQWDADAQFLASRGYVVIEPEYRGSLGFGNTHFEAGWKRWESSMQDDVADALASVVAKGLVDPKRVCIAGASYGGYATLMGLIRYPELYRCGIAWAAVTDPRLMFDESWRSDVSEESRTYGYTSLVGDPVKDAEMLRRAAPLERAAEIRAPVLLAFGAEDRRVPLRHGTLMHDALRAQGRDPEWVVYDGEGHGWLKVDNRIDFWSRVERFLDKNLNAAPAAR